MMAVTENDCILRAIECYKFREKFWVFLDLMDAGALTMFIEDHFGKYDEAACQYVCYKTLMGLRFLHQRGIMHRDIKSDNILVSSEGEVVLADFGYAVQLTQENKKRVSKVGTVCWMAPEMILAQSKYDDKVDIWSFGIFVLELADREPPYLNLDQNKVLYNIVNNPSPQIQSKTWSPLFRDFAAKCLAKDPAQRQNSEQLLNHEWLKNADSKRINFCQAV